MKWFAVLWIAGSVFAQVPYQRPSAPPEPRRVNMTPQGANRLQKIVPRNKMAAPKAGERGAGVPHKKVRMRRKMKNGSK